ncbi:hypothetical protein C8J56DRAFT_771415 [Mycena floridula]|nr:hypothetical protein C8J56DRAFT_771415 [Mycena floridula]
MALRSTQTSPSQHCRGKKRSWSLTSSADASGDDDEPDCSVVAPRLQKRPFISSPSISLSKPKPSQNRPSVRPSLSSVTILGYKLKPTVLFDALFYWISERKNIYDRRLAGLPQSYVVIFQPGKSINNALSREWTADENLKHHRFTNCYRVLDRTTNFIIKEVIEKGSQNELEIVFRVVLFNLFTKIETWELLEEKLGTLTWAAYDQDKYYAVLKQAAREKKAICTGSFQKPPPKFFYGDARDYLAQLEAIMGGPVLHELKSARFLNEIFLYLKSHPGLGDFGAFQLLLNLSYTNVFNFSGNDFVVSGLGCNSGIEKMFERKGLGKARKAEENMYAGIIRYLCETQSIHFQRLGLDVPGLGPDNLPLDLADIEHSICEVDKFARLAYPGLPSSKKQLKRTFIPSDKPLPPPAIPRAWSNPARKVSRIWRSVELDGELDDHRRFIVEFISDKRFVDGSPEYLVHWEGYTETTWEPLETLAYDVPHKVTEFDNRHEETTKKKKPSKKRKSRR